MSRPGGRHSAYRRRGAHRRAPAQERDVAAVAHHPRLDPAFEYMAKSDPFSGHVVIRSTDAETTGSVYRLWTTLKVPHGFSLQRHGELLAERVGADHFRLMPAKGIFTLGVGHVRRGVRRQGRYGSRRSRPVRRSQLPVRETIPSEGNATARRSP